MEKYDSGNNTMTRTKKNKNLYNDLSDRLNIDYVDINVDNAIEFDSRKMNNNSREDYQKKKEFDYLLNNRRSKKYPEESTVKIEENKIYDINEILKLARQDKLFESEEKKRLLNTEYNILTKLDIESIENENIKKEDLKELINDIYKQEEPRKMKNYSRREEEELFNDLISNDGNDTVSQSLQLKEELSKEILDKTKKQESELSKEKEEIATKINPATLEDFDDKITEEKEGKGLTIAIIAITILILLVVGYFVIDYFFGIDLPIKF